MVGMHKWFLEAMKGRRLCRNGEMWGSVHGKGFAVDGVCSGGKRTEHGARIRYKGVVGKLLLLMLVGSHCLLLVATNIREGGATMHVVVVVGRLLVLGLGMMGVLWVSPVTSAEGGLSRLVQVGHWCIGGDIVVIKLLKKGATWGWVESERVGVCPKRGVCGMRIWMNALVWGMVCEDVVKGLDIKIVLCKGLHLV
jgi:hypothetical protein